MLCIYLWWTFSKVCKHNTKLTSLQGMPIKDVGKTLDVVTIARLATKALDCISELMQCSHVLFA